MPKQEKNKLDEIKRVVTEFSLSVPTHLNPPKRSRKKKKMPLNLNWYRNAHYTSANTAKRRFSELVEIDLLPIKFDSKVRIVYTFYSDSKRKSDVANWCSIVDKFFCDALVEFGCIEDDHYGIVNQVTYKYGGIDKGNAKVDIEVISNER